MIGRTWGGKAVIYLRADGMRSRQCCREIDSRTGDLRAGSVRMSERGGDCDRGGSEPSD